MRHEPHPINDLVGRPVTEPLAVKPSLLAIEPTVPLCLLPIALLPLPDSTFSQSLLFCDFGFGHLLFPFQSWHSPIAVVHVAFLLCSDVPMFALRAFGCDWPPYLQVYIVHLWHTPSFCSRCFPFGLTPLTTSYISPVVATRPSGKTWNRVRCSPSLSLQSDSSFLSRSLSSI